MRREGRGSNLAEQDLAAVGFDPSKPRFGQGRGNPREGASYGSKGHGNTRRQTEQAAHHVASGAVGAVRALRELPAAYRPLLIEQLRTMGGTRFLVFFNGAEVPVTLQRRPQVA